MDFQQRGKIIKVYYSCIHKVIQCQQFLKNSGLGGGGGGGGEFGSGVEIQGKRGWGQHLMWGHL